MGSVIRQYMKILLIWVIGITAIVYTGCSQTTTRDAIHVNPSATNSLSSNVEQPSLTASLQTTITPQDYLRPTSDHVPLSCNSMLIPITNSEVSNFTWSDDSNYLYYVLSDQLDQWWSYNIQEEFVKKTQNPDLVPTPTVPPFVSYQVLNSIKDWRDIIVSPSGEQVVYIEWSGSVPTPQIEGEHGGNQESFNHLYLIKESNPLSRYLGEIQGSIDHLIWSPDESFLLAIMNEYAPSGPGLAYVWKIDLINNTITPIFSVNERSMGPIIRDISPNFRNILYFDRTDDHIHVRDIINNSDIVLPISLTPWTWWFNDNEKIIALGEMKSPGSSFYSVYTFDLGTGEQEQISSEILHVKQSPGSLLLSPDKQRIAYLDNKSEWLYVLSLCADVE